MSTVTCYECKKKYNYDEDGFCPRCGSFNQPRRGSYTVAENGDIVRLDGINEAAHKSSFVHAEYHAEERDRQKRGLDRENPQPRSSAQTGHQQGKSAAKKRNPAGVVFMIIWLMILLSMLFNVVAELL